MSVTTKYSDYVYQQLDQFFWRKEETSLYTTLLGKLNKRDKEALMCHKLYVFDNIIPQE